MQFISKGPDVPDDLLRFHEEGKVVFFCGAGISKGAGLPDFRGLVKRVWKEVGNNAISAEEKKYMRTGRYDAALGFLEKKFNDAGVVRNGLATVLSDYRQEKNYDRTHKSLLTLSRTRGVNTDLHLVTTNFDRLFENLNQDPHYHHNSYVAPLLPIPKHSNWDGVVYLHGLLPKADDEKALKNLVVTSGDFGRAYLKERWAARFVSELFRGYVVCFVGYSLADPVMRYLADAIEADKADGEDTKPIYMFVAGESSDSLNRSKSITCINYSVENGHELLHKTLEEWAKTYSSGALGREAIIDTNADIDPDKMKDDGYVGQMIWALSDTAGIGAKRFSSHNPVPSFNWAKVLMSEKGNVPVVKKQDKTPLLCLSESDLQQDVRRYYIFSWLLRHLSNPELVWMVLREGDALHPDFKRQLSRALDKQLEESNKESGNALNPIMYRLWRLILAGKVLSNESKCLRGMEKHHLINRLKKEKLDYSLLDGLRELLAPVVFLEKPFHLTFSKENDGHSDNNPYSCFNWRLCLKPKGGMGEYYAEEVRKSLEGKYGEAFDSIESALMDGLEALYYLDENAESSSIITFDILSIEKHSQNKEEFHEWRRTVDLLRDAWLELADKDKNRAHAAYQRWITSKHFLLQRLALFAAKRSDVISPHEWHDSLLANHGFILWMTSSQREVLRLLATTSKDLCERDFNRLANAIASGPPPSMFMSLEKEKASELIDRDIWLRLKKMECHEHKLPKRAKCKLAEISARFPKWTLLRNQQEEFLIWSYGTGDPDYEAEMRHVIVPDQIDQMTNWLSEDIGKPEYVFNQDDNWRSRCKEIPHVVFAALEALAGENKWNVKRIREALSVWHDATLVKYRQEFIEKYIVSCPDEPFKNLTSAILDWCEVAVKEKSISDEVLFKLARRISSMVYENDTPERRDAPEADPFSDAINHPIGRMMGILLDACFGDTISKGQGIPDAFMKEFSHVCSTPGLGLRHGRVILASRIVGLYYADEKWVREYLYPLLDWNRNHYEARGAWAGLLMNGRLLPPLMSEIKRDFLSTANHLNELNAAIKRYCSLLTLMGLRRVPGYSLSDFKGVFTSLSVSALDYCAETIRRHQTNWLDSDIEKMDERNTPEKLWLKDVKPFVRKVWPTDELKLSKDIRKSFMELVIATGKEFPDALISLKWALKSCDEKNGRILRLMKDKTRCLQDFPDESLTYLSKVAQNIKWIEADILEGCLSEIANARPDLVKDGRYLQLMDKIKQLKTLI